MPALRPEALNPLLVLGVLALLFAANLFLTSKIISRLREHHPRVYKQLGEPTLTRDNRPFSMVERPPPRSSFLLLGFILRGAYRELGDSRLTALATACRALTVSHFLGLVMLWWLVPT